MKLENGLKDYLDSCVERFNQTDFIKNDPISIPHQFSTLQDIEIVAFWVAMLAWGQRKTIINKSLELIDLMSFRASISALASLTPMM